MAALGTEVVFEVICASGTGDLVRNCACLIESSHARIQAGLDPSFNRLAWSKGM